MLLDQGLIFLEYMRMFYSHITIDLYICNLQKDFRTTSILWTLKDPQLFQQSTIDKDVSTLQPTFMFRTTGKAHFKYFMPPQIFAFYHIVPISMQNFLILTIFNKQNPISKLPLDLLISSNYLLVCFPLTAKLHDKHIYCI